MVEEEIRALTMGGMAKHYSQLVQSWILRRLHDLEMNRAELARKTGLSEGGISQILSDSDRQIRKATLAKLTAVLGPAPVVEDVSGGQSRSKGIQLYEEPSYPVDVIDWTELEAIPVDLEGEAFMAEIRARRFGRVSSEVNAPGIFAIRLPRDMGPYPKGYRLTIHSHLAPLEGEHVLIKMKKVRKLGTWGTDEDGSPAVSLLEGGIARNFRLVGTVVEAGFSTLKQPR